MDGYQVTTLEDVVSIADIFVTATGSLTVITADDMAKMKHQAIVGNIGHFDNEIDMAGLAKIPGIVRVNIKPQVDEWIFPDGHGVIVLSEGLLEPRQQRHGPPELPRDVELLHQSDDGPDGAVLLKSENTATRWPCCCRSTRRKGRPLRTSTLGVKPTIPLRRAGFVSRRPGRGAVQARPLHRYQFLNDERRARWRLTEFVLTSPARTAWASSMRSRASSPRRDAISKKANSSPIRVATASSCASRHRCPRAPTRWRCESRSSTAVDASEMEIRLWDRDAADPRPRLPHRALPERSSLSAFNGLAARKDRGGGFQPPGFRAARHRLRHSLPLPAGRRHQPARARARDPASRGRARGFAARPRPLYAGSHPRNR